MMRWPSWTLTACLHFSLTFISLIHCHHGFLVIAFIEIRDNRIRIEIRKRNLPKNRSMINYLYHLASNKNPFQTLQTLLLAWELCTFPSLFPFILFLFHGFPLSHKDYYRKRNEEKKIRAEVIKPTILEESPWMRKEPKNRHERDESVEAQETVPSWPAVSLSRLQELSKENNPKNGQRLILDFSFISPTSRINCISKYFIFYLIFT